MKRSPPLMRMLRKLFSQLDVVLDPPPRKEPEVHPSEPLHGDAYSRGLAFEHLVAQTIRTHYAGKQCDIFRNVYIPYKGKTAEIDIVVLLDDKLLVVECKNYKGTIYANHDERTNWVQYLNSENKYPLYSPVRQNQSHIEALASVLGLQANDCVCVVVFADTATLRDIPARSSNLLICTLKDLSRWLDSLLLGRRLPYSRERLAQILKGYAMSDDELRKRHAAYVKAVSGQSRYKGG